MCIPVTASKAYDGEGVGTWESHTRIGNRSFGFISAKCSTTGLSLPGYENNHPTEFRKLTGNNERVNESRTSYEAVWVPSIFTFSPSWILPERHRMSAMAKSTRAPNRLTEISFQNQKHSRYIPGTCLIDLSMFWYAQETLESHTVFLKCSQQINPMLDLTFLAKPSESKKYCCCFATFSTIGCSTEF